jgi:hypothetical protein
MLLIRPASVLTSLWMLCVSFGMWTSLTDFAAVRIALCWNNPSSSFSSGLPVPHVDMLGLVAVRCSVASGDGSAAAPGFLGCIVIDCERTVLPWLSSAEALASSSNVTLGPRSSASFFGWAPSLSLVAMPSVF